MMVENLLLYHLVVVIQAVSCDLSVCFPLFLILTFGTYLALVKCGFRIALLILVVQTLYVFLFYTFL